MNFKEKSELLVLVLRINVISNLECRSLCTDFLPPSSGVFRLSLAGSWPGIPCRRSFGSQGSMKACRKHITIKQVFLGRIRSGSCERLWIEHTIITLKFLGGDTSAFCL